VVEQQPGSEDLFPDGLPPIVQRIWDVVLNVHYASGKHESPTRRGISNLLLDKYPGQAWSVASVNRAFARYPELLPKNIHRGDLPPWLEQPELLKAHTYADLEGHTYADVESGANNEPLRLMAFDNDGQPCIVKAVVDKRTGVPRIITHVVAAGFALVPLLDSLDGVTDHVIHWCRILVGAFHHVLF